VQADVHDDATLQRLLQSADAAINLVGILHGDFDRAHVQLPHRIAAACARASVQRLVHVSALKAAPDAPSAYLRSKAAGEAAIREAQGEHLQTTILQPSVIFGREDRFLNLFARLARALPAIVLASPAARFQPVHVDDVARAIAAALSDVRTFGQTYALCGPQVYTLRELVAYVVRSLGLHRPIVGLGKSLSMLQAGILEHLPGKLMTRDNVRSMQVDNVCGCAFPEVFGFEPTPLEAVVPLYIAGVTPRSRYRWFRFRARR
jgi:NADH dehydrogenase